MILQNSSYLSKCMIKGNSLKNWTNLITNAISAINAVILNTFHNYKRV